MQVRDLIEQLQKFDPSAEVAIEAALLIEQEEICEIEKLEMDSTRFRVLLLAY